MRGITCLLVAAAGVTAAATPRSATPPESITVPPGFRVELLRSAQEGEDSWISMSFDPRGRIVVGLDKQGVARLTPRGDDWEFDRLDDTLRHCRGVLCAHDAIYVAATDSKEFWRFRDSAGDDRFADRTLLKSFDYRSRYGHGQNQIVLGPDRMLYLVIGDDVSFPEGTSPASPYRHPQVDRLLADPHDVGRDERVGSILRTDPEGREWTVLAGGLRNQFDAAFSPDGELFTWDADMEWDVGQPWYRPTRLIHVVSAGEYGWRWGTAPWPPFYPDSLPATLETGLASPTALAFGNTSGFPEPLRHSLFMADWQHGRILAVTLDAAGASYTATDAVFAEGAPLNVCDMEFGPDGALYVITGGRGSQSGLYRISSTAPETSAPPDVNETPSAAAARARRRALERYHAGPVAGAVDDLWPDLGSADRWLRHAARVALERQPLASWRERARVEPDALRRGEAILAWARMADAEDRDDVVRAVLAAPAASDETVVLLGLRALAIAIARGVDLGADAAAVHARLASFDGHPAATVQRELVELLVATRAPGTVAAVLRRLDRAPGQEEQIHCVHALVRWEGPWSAVERRRILRWFADARGFTGGHLLPKILARMQDDFIAGLSADERGLLAPELVALDAPAAPADLPAETTRPVVRRWAVADLAPHLGAIDGVRDPARARTALAAGQCLKCHKLGGAGSAVGPDLSAVGRRFDLRSIAESIIEPSKIVDPKYHATTFELASGRVVTGRSARVSSQEIEVEVDPLRGRTEKIARADIEATHPSTVSPMPQGLLDTLSLDEILDLLAAVRAGGVPAGD